MIRQDEPPSTSVVDESARRTTGGAHPSISRREAIAGVAGAVTGAVLGAARPLAGQQAATAPLAIPPDPTRTPGMPSESLGGRSPFERPALAPVGVTTGSSLSPLQDIRGTITPADLHFQRHHNGIAMIDPQRWELVIHGLVDRPTVFTLRDLERLPSITRICVLECSGNGRTAYRAPAPEMTPQQVDGLSSNSEWTGVPLRVLFAEVGVQPRASWILAEGGDAAVLSRSVPLEKGLDDAFIAYAQNGEALRPANGYPARLMLPGFEGNMCIKWIRRLELKDGATMTRDETAKYTDPLPNGTARQFSFVMDAKSIITSPARPMRVSAPGWWPVTGLAWSGRGVITRVDVSTDGGATWTRAMLQEPALAKAYTRFVHMWKWDGKPALLMSRAIDETGYVQPTIEAFRRARGPGTDYHYNHIRAWQVAEDGTVTFAGGGA
jgi:sulfane dehydrogenase subunit SoxC